MTAHVTDVKAATENMADLLVFVPASHCEDDEQWQSVLPPPCYLKL